MLGIANNKNRSTNQDSEDRFSSLPDSLIHHILSFLYMNDVIKTSLLSRRWRYIWTWVPVLDFGTWLYEDLTFIDMCLRLYQGQKVRRISIHLWPTVDECRIDSWFRFAVSRGVEELDISYYNYGDKGKIPYDLPQCVVNSGEFKILKLGFFDLNYCANLYLGSLTVLHLDHVELVYLDVSGCPLLEKLEIECCSSIHHIHAPNKKLRYLWMYDELDRHDYSSGLTLFAPSLLTIEFDGDMRNAYNFENLSSITSAGLLFDDSNTHDYDELIELLKSLSHAKTLKVSQWCVEVMGIMEGEMKTTPLSATCLELKIKSIKSGLHGISSLLASSLFLETLVINFCFKDNDYHALELWELLECAMSSIMQLKTVMIHNFLENRVYLLRDEAEEASLGMDQFLENKLANELKLVKTLLKSCKMLDKMIIRTTRGLPISLLKSAFLPMLMKKLLDFPRASATTEIDFSW